MMLCCTFGRRQNECNSGNCTCCWFQCPLWHHKWLILRANNWGTHLLKIGSGFGSTHFWQWVGGERSVTDSWTRQCEFRRTRSPLGFQLKGTMRQIFGRNQRFQYVGALNQQKYKAIKFLVSSHKKKMFISKCETFRLLRDNYHVKMLRFNAYNAKVLRNNVIVSCFSVKMWHIHGIPK